MEGWLLVNGTHELQRLGNDVFFTRNFFRFHLHFCLFPETTENSGNMFRHSNLNGMYCQLHFVGGLDEAVRQQLCSSTNTSMTAPFYGERTTKVGALGKNSAGKCVFELSNGMFYRQTGQTGAKKTYLDYFRWHYSIYMVKIQISCYLFAWIKPVAGNG